MDAITFGALIRSMPRHMVDMLATDLEKARLQAKSAGLERDFALAWEYEKERARQHPGCALKPMAVMRLVVMVGRE